MTDFVTELRSGRVLLMDGAMGTELQRLDETLPEDERISLIHSAYVQSSAEVILTNTFQTNPTALAKLGRADQHHSLWQNAIEFARRPQPRYVLGDVGPVEQCTAEIAAGIWHESAALDGLLLETWTSIKHLELFAIAHQLSNVPLLVSFTYYRDSNGVLRTFEGATPVECALAAKRCGAVAIGANCGKEIGMADMRELVRRYHDACDLPVFVRPNAGTPVRTQSGWVYPRTAEAMAAELPLVLDEGIAMIGGCCGVGPEYIERFREVLALARDGIQSNPISRGR